METQRESVEPTERVHVRYLDVSDTFRWSWEVLTERPELFGVTLAVGLLTVPGVFGVSRPSPSAPAEFAGWVWPLYLGYFLAVTVAWGVVYQTAEDAVANHSRPLADRLVGAAKRLPALFVTGILTWLVTAVGFVLLVIPGLYLFSRLVLAYPACVIDRKGPIASIKASWAATSGRTLKVFAASLVYFVLLSVSNFVTALFGGALSLTGSLVSVVLSAGMIPLFGLALAHLYLEHSRNR